MTADELRRAHLKVLGTFFDYRWKIAEKYGIVRFNLSMGIEGFNNDEWERVASEEERKQATILHDNTIKAFQAYYDAWRKEEGFSENELEELEK